ncbi:geranylgeranylglyceryl/heptaprenylglyceryl phosphate synthase [Candidatus Bathyarchaeota archaeon]|nr:geranylgeranylglyceryl/heptaprenylglyceryl phosphate synthase [Candidatus Bathyarchaeota archaeon]MBS7630786.1 geranylgeranylglyceryl/heptaprenylglyceryl phosphate synthase [Candidatus Bathyarchaeota archaeon]
MDESVKKYIHDKIKRDGTLHMTLLDPEKTGPEKSCRIAIEAEKGGSSAIMVGGSTLASNQILDEVVKTIKKSVNIPVILFPNNISGISPYADAIWFMSLLNSSNTYYLIDVQALTAKIIKKYGLEALSMGYIIVGEGGAAGFIGQARHISYEHPELVLGYSLAAEILGMQFIYIEAGSGASIPVPLEMVKMVKSHISIPLIVGGGIRDDDTAFKIAEAGADIIVTGTIIEETDLIQSKIGSIVEKIKLAKVKH